jgi:hypothetical protein
MVLLDDFEFVDDDGKSWVAPTGSFIDGASIPEILWSTNGSPFVGDYRRASVLHDVHCSLRTEPHKAVHRMFYDAMLCDGVGSFRAKKMFAAVRLFGPSWSLPGDAGADAAAAPSDETGISIDDLELVLDQVLGE